jgi:O-antigen/teichoic acid export membrane protein
MNELSTRSLRARTSVISAHKVAQIAGSLTAVVLLPRLLGIEDFGRLSFVLALTFLGAILADLGTLDVFGRFVPNMEPAEARKLYMRTLAFSLAVSLLCFVVTAAAALLLAQWMSLAWALMAGAMVVLRVASWTPFQFALARNRIGAWMTEQAWRQWVMLAALLLLYPLLGFTGALLALLVMEALFAGLGFWWARDEWLAAEFRVQWSYYRFYFLAGLGFFLANLAAVALYRSGPVLVEALSGDSAEVGYVSLAIGMYLMVYVTISQFAQSLIPSLSELHARGRHGETERRLGSFMRAGLAVTAAGVVAVWLLADWAAPLAFGQDFAGAAPALRWISLAMPAAVIVWAANVTATVTGQGAVKFSAILAALLTFVAGAVALVPAREAAGAAGALSAAVFVQAVVLAVRLRPAFRLRALLT